MGLNLASQTAFTGENAEPQASKKAPPSPEEIAAHFPQFSILECLGRGGMGVVYKAVQKSLDRVVALKILAPEREKDPQFASRFAREAKTLAQLSHPNIVTVHDFGEVDGMCYLVMEFVDGMNLRQLLRDQKLTPQEALAIVPPVCEALQYAHNRGVVHRDIKPENLLLDKQGRIKIADFGIAKLMDAQPNTGQDRLNKQQPVLSDPSPASLTDATKVVGTPTYMAPEQESDPARVDHRADIYSLGVVLYEMLTGELPSGKFQSPSSRRLQVDVRIDEIVLRALEKEPDRRYQSATQFKTQVETMTPMASGSDAIAASAQKSDGVLAQPAAKAPKLPSRSFYAAGITSFVVWLLVTLSVQLVAFLQPATYVGISRINIESVDPGKINLFKYDPYFSQTVMEVIHSTAVLGRVVEQLNLNKRWAEQLGSGESLDTYKAIEILERRITLSQEKDTSLISIHASSKDPKEAAELANSIAESYRFCWEQTGKLAKTNEYNSQGNGIRHKVEIVDRAEVPQRPSKPNVPLIIELGTLGGGLAGLLAGCCVLLMAARRNPGYSRRFFSQPSSIALILFSIIILFTAIGYGWNRVKSLGTDNAQNALIKRNTTFGPVIECVVNDLANKQGNDAIQLSSGHLFSLPFEEKRFYAGAKSLAERHQWLEKSGADLLVDWVNNGQLQIAPGCKLAAFYGDFWFVATSEGLSKAVNREVNGVGTRTGTSERYYYISSNPDFPITVVFETHDKRLGILQITGSNENPRGLRIRYKLLNPDRK